MNVPDIPKIYTALAEMVLVLCICAGFRKEV